MAPPAKRQRRARNIVLSSPPSSAVASKNYSDAESTASEDSEDELAVAAPPPATRTLRTSASRSTLTSTRAEPIATKESKEKVQTRAKTANHPHNAAPIYLPTKRSAKSMSSSPEKNKTKKDADAKEKGKNGNILTFFTSKVEAQRDSLGEAGSGSQKRKGLLSRTSSIASVQEEISDDEDVAGKVVGGSIVGSLAMKRARAFGAPTSSAAPVPENGDVVSGSQRFMKKTLPQKIQMEDTRPWADRFGPANLEELVVHKKKVADVRGWLENTMAGRNRQRVLVLKGAAGTGKTTTVQLLSKAMDAEILEWRNPIGSVSSADGISSMSAQFEEFMGRGGKFGQLDIFSTEEGAESKPDIKPLDRRKKIILIEEFPNTLVRSSTGLQSFRTAILEYLAANTPPLAMMYAQSRNQEIVTPVVMVVSETLLTTTSASADSFTAHRLLGPEILQHPGVSMIEFNPVAPTLLAKALDLVVQKESRKSGRRRTPGPAVLKALGEAGDVRSAVGSLEFLCLRGDQNAEWSGKVTFGKSKKNAAAMTKMEQESLELVTRRETSLGIFHAVGKVVYNKREGNVPRGVENLPTYLSQCSRPKRSEVEVDQLTDETGTDTQTFVAALHENYALSCDPSSDEYSAIDHINGCIDALSDSDLLSPSWDGSGTGGRGSGGDILRQDEISFQVAVRGLLFSLPNPVKRLAAAEGRNTGSRTVGSNPGRGDTHKMFYPTSLKLWREKEEIESMIDLWVARAMKGEPTTTNVTARAAAFANLKSKSSWNNRAAPDPSPSTKAKNDDEPLPLIASGSSARKEMLLERLPYMVQIARVHRSGNSMLAIRDMEKVTAFHGIGGPSEENEDLEGDDEVGLEWATDKVVDRAVPGKRVGIRDDKFKGGFGFAGGIGVENGEAVQGLTISDDDIEDF